MGIAPNFVVVLAGRHVRLHLPPRLAQFPLGTLSNPSIQYSYEPQKKLSYPTAGTAVFLAIPWQAREEEPCHGGYEVVCSRLFGNKRHAANLSSQQEKTFSKREQAKSTEEQSLFLRRCRSNTDWQLRQKITCSTVEQGGACPMWNMGAGTTRLIRNATEIRTRKIPTIPWTMTKQVSRQSMA